MPPQHASPTNILKALEIENPGVFVPWKISARRLREICRHTPLDRVGNDYYVLPCTILRGLQLRLGFHFERPIAGLIGPARLTRFELFRKDDPDLARCYAEFQRHLELCFGPPSKTVPGNEGFETHTWEFENIRIVHDVHERFTLNHSAAIARL